MFMSCLSVCIFGALIMVVHSDYQCFMQNLPSTGLNAQDLNAVAGICSDMPKMVRELTRIKDMCSFDVDVEGVKRIMEETCDKDSERYKNAAETKTCVGQLMRHGNPCPPPTFTSSLTVQRCKRLVFDQLDCMANHVGKTCGDKAYKAVKSGGDLSDTLLRGLCPELARLSSSARPLGNSALWILLVFLLIWMRMVRL